MDNSLTRSGSHPCLAGQTSPQGKALTRKTNKRGRYSPYRSPCRSPMLRHGMRLMSISAPELSRYPDQPKAACRSYCKATPKGNVELKDVTAIGAKLYVQPSSIPNAGRGLFTRNKINKGELITYFDGTIHDSSPELKNLARDGVIDTSYFVAVDFHQYIDCISEPRDGAGGGSFANDSLGCAYPLNARIIQQNRPGYEGTFLKATRDIAPNEEILCKYSKSHWKWAQAFWQKQEEPLQIPEKRLTLEGLEKRLRVYDRKIEWVTAYLIREGFSFPCWPELKSPAASGMSNEDQAVNEKCLAVELLCFKLGLLSAIELSHDLIQRMKTPPKFEQCQASTLPPLQKVIRYPGTHGSVVISCQE